jgi:hypothetical protein
MRPGQTLHPRAYGICVHITMLAPTRGHVR